MLPLAVALALFPVPIIAAVLVLGSGRGPAKGGAFAGARLLGLVGVGGAVLLFAGAVDPTEGAEPATWVSVLLLCLGALLLALAVGQWRGRPRAGEDAPLPGWMRKVDDLSVAKAAGAGFALSALSPKSILLVAGAAAEIAEVGLPAGQQAVVLLIFALIASAGVLTPLALSLALGQRAAALLDGLRDRMVAYNAVIMAVLFAVIGAKLIGDAISDLSG